MKEKSITIKLTDWYAFILQNSEGCVRLNFWATALYIKQKSFIFWISLTDIDIIFARYTDFGFTNNLLSLPFQSPVLFALEHIILVLLQCAEGYLTSKMRLTMVFGFAWFVGLTLMSSLVQICSFLSYFHDIGRFNVLLC